ncbi:MAG: NAD(P)H-hydrate dehydratase [Proteobacteria bacterium]|nr:NAD(P)H-hydrate dehydratase [Pseudomonadota bacterium]
MNSTLSQLTIEPAMFAGLLAPRGAAAHKGTFGHVLIFAGSGGHLGAGYLAALAALRAGCGLCTLCLPEGAFARFDARYPEVMCDPIPDGGAGFFTPEGLAAAHGLCEGKQAMAIGPALGTAEGTGQFVNRLLLDSELPAVVDADALNVLDLDALSRRGSPSVLTPHPGEMAGLLGSSADEVQADRTGAAAKLARQTRAFVVLKGHGTVVAAPDGRLATNPTGNPGMASAGMGDALTGIVASFIAQGAGAWEASLAAVYIHGLAGDIAARELGEASVIASDVIGRLGAAIKEIAYRI